MENEVTVCEPQGKQVAAAGQPIDQILALAIQQGAPLEQLEKWMNLKRQHESDEARKAFFKAVASFKREQIKVSKDKVNTQFKSKYTTLGNLLETVNPFLGKHGLSVSFIPSQSEKMVSVKCVLSHELGHTESVEMSAPPDTSGGNSKNPIQQIKSTFTYLRSATFEAVTGLSGTDASIDDDGNQAGGVEYISTDQQTALTDIINELYGDDHSAILKAFGVDSIEHVPAKDYSRHMAGLKQLQEKRAKR